MDNRIKSSTKIFEVLEMISLHNEVSVTEVSKQTGFTMSTTQRIINSLEDLNYIIQNKDNLRYMPSYKLFALGNRVMKSNALLNSAMKHIQELYDETNETVNLGTLEDGNIFYLHKIISKEPLRIEIGIGYQAPFYCTALGKAIVSFDPSKMPDNFRFHQYTDNTITSRSELLSELAIIKARGYAIDNEEFMNGLYCIGIPILNVNGIPEACISVSFPKSRWSPEKENSLLHHLQRTVQKVESEIR